jgi:glycosyltransferase involved in cell wall biosynthesis
VRIAVVSPFIDRRHGTERALAELLERLAGTYGCEIHLFAQRVADLSVECWSAGRARENSGVIFWHPVVACPSGFPLLFSFTWWFWMNRVTRWWFSLIHRVRFPVVLSGGINCSDANVVIAHALFHRLQELAREKSTDGTTTTTGLRLAHRRAYYARLAKLERRIYGNSQVTLAAVSPRTAEQLRMYFSRSDVPVIANGVDGAFFCPAERQARREEARSRRGVRAQELLLLLIGNDWEVKGVGTVLHAMAQVPDLPLRFLVVGSDAAESFQALAKTLGVSERCMWEGPADDVRDCYAAADVYVCPSQEDSFGLPVAEAMASGLAVITSMSAGIGWLVEDGVDGFVLRDPLDAATLAQLLRLLHGQPELRERIGNAGTRTAQGWTWERNAADAWKLLQSVAASAHRGNGTEQPR